MRPASSIPVKENDEVRVKIEALGEKGDGVAKIQGFAIIIPKVIVGREYMVRITAVKSKFAFGEAIEKFK